MGTKSGELQVFDIAASTMTESIQAHESAVWSLHVRPDGKALVTGSADKDVKFWELEQQSVDVCEISLPQQPHARASRLNRSLML